MDAFTVFLPRELSTANLENLAHDAGFSSFVSAEREISVFLDDAYVWVELLKPEEITPGELEAQDEWPIQLADVRTMVNITVRRTKESDDIAVTLAYLLATRCGGVISWDGMDYWEQLYRAYGERNK